MKQRRQFGPLKNKSWIQVIFSDVECIYTVMCNLVTKSENPDEVLEIVKLRKVTEHIIPLLEKIDHYLKEWNLRVQDQREVFLAIFNNLKEMRPNKEAANAILEFVKAPDMFQ
ncbi:Eukaryotic translation initiation factor 3 subunit M, partial [Bienertia sinuspersici]